MAAAYRPVRELLQQERKMKDKVRTLLLPPSILFFIVSFSWQSSTVFFFFFLIFFLKKKKQDDHEEQTSEKEIVLRPLNMEDIRQAKNQVTAIESFRRVDIHDSSNIFNLVQIAASFATEGLVMDELKHWNALYGEGGSRTTKQLTYFL